jgi:hypothetical protein
VALVEEVLAIYLHKFNELVEDAIKFRILKKMEERAILNGEIEEYYYYNKITSQIENQEFDITPLSFDAEFSTSFTRPIKKLLEYSKRNSVNLLKKGIYNE